MIGFVPINMFSSGHVATNIKEKAQHHTNFSNKQCVVKHANFTTCSHQTFHFTANPTDISQGVKLHSVQRKYIQVHKANRRYKL